MHVRTRIAIAAGLFAAAAFPSSARAACARLQDRLTTDELASVELTPRQLARLDELLCARTPPQPAAAGLDAEPVRTTLRGRVEGWAPDTVFTLDDGQVWKVLKGRYRLPHPVENPSVRLVPGLGGRWFLEIDPDAPKARVYRVD